MTLSRTEVVPGLVAELEAFGELIGASRRSAWAPPTRCEGWAVGDVAAHVVGSIADVVSGRLEGLGRPRSPPGRWPSARVAARPSWPRSWRR